MVARTFHETNLTPQDVCDVLLPLLPPEQLTFVLDRTSWKRGTTDLNLLGPFPTESRHHDHLHP